MGNREKAMKTAQDLESLIHEWMKDIDLDVEITEKLYTNILDEFVVTIKIPYSAEL